MQATTPEDAREDLRERAARLRADASRVRVGAAYADGQATATKSPTPNASKPRPASSNAKPTSRTPANPHPQEPAMLQTLAEHLADLLLAALLWLMPMEEE